MSVPSYRFFTADLLTQTVLGELQLFDCSADMALNTTGNFTGSFPLGQGPTLDALNMSITQPGRTSLYILRNGLWMWGGIIWARDYDSQTRQVTLTGQTFESFFDRVVLERNFVQQNVDQGLIFQTLINRVQAQAGCNIGLGQFGNTSTGTNRTILLPAYEFHYASEVLQACIEADDGMDYNIFLSTGSNQDQPNRIVTYQIQGVLNGGFNFYLDYPGNVLSYTWPENAFQGGDKFAGRGAGDGNKAPTAVYQDATLIASGYPSLWSVYNYSLVTDKKLVKSRTKRKMTTDKVPIVEPTFTVTGDTIDAAAVSVWQSCGGQLTININDARFPNGFSTTRKFYGWQATFQSATDQETIVLTTDNGATL